MIKRLALIVAMLLIPALAKADTVWTYTGNIMHGVTQNATNAPGGCGCALDGTFTLNAAGVATSWDFTDGTHTLTTANSMANISLRPGIGGFLNWNINIFNSSWYFSSQFIGSGFEATDSSGVTHWGDPGCCFGFLESNRGTLTESIATPEPGSLMLLTAGMALSLFGCISSRLNRQPVQ
jgi:PEP-CTERM motif